MQADGRLPFPASRPAALEDALDFEGLEDETEGVMAQVGAACQQYAGGESVCWEESMPCVLVDWAALADAPVP